MFRYKACPQSTIALSRLLKNRRKKVKASHNKPTHLHEPEWSSPWGLVGPPLSSSQLGPQTSGPDPVLPSAPCLCLAATEQPGAQTEASVRERARGGWGGTEGWHLLAVVAFRATVLQMDRCRTRGILQPRVGQDLWGKQKFQLLSLNRMPHFRLTFS